ncbi:MAG TPA: histidinol-phosphate transaminase [Candidatus Acidoferrales bacterium]|nr:histidinol-phosphate transaminase [Candidatus Acidoferrales bacterium]
MSSGLTTRPDWDGLAAYRPEPAAPSARLDLSDNTSRFGVPPAAALALAAEPVAALARYPHADAAPLRCALADYAGVLPGQIVTGCGSDDVLDSAFRALAAPGARCALLAPTFPMAERFARLNGLSPSSAPLSRDGGFDPDALLAGAPALVYLCSPNNPTGAALDPDALEYVIAHAPGAVVLDEAYAEFADGDWIARAPSRPNLLVTRTLSKAFGLAALRVGYAAATGRLIERVELSRGPYKVSGIAERVATAALRDDRPWVRERAAQAAALRDRLSAALRGLGLEPLPSAANFVSVPVRDAAALAAATSARGVALRALPALPGFGDVLRITVAPWPELERALAALAEALRCA